MKYSTESNTKGDYTTKHSEQAVILITGNTLEGELLRELCVVHNKEDDRELGMRTMQNKILTFLSRGIPGGAR